MNSNAFEFLPSSGDASVILPTDLLSIPHRGKFLEKLIPFNFTFKLLDHGLSESESLSELGRKVAISLKQSYYTKEMIR